MFCDKIYRNDILVYKNRKERGYMSEFIKTTEYANAKINLYLDVTGIRKDGFHDIVSIMQTIDLCDRVDIKARVSTDVSVSLSCNWSHIPNGPENLVWRAVESFCRVSGVSLEVEMYLEKRIPSEAGLAGGSADAAAVLRALRRSFAPDMPLSALEDCAASLGSDVPFCLYGGSAICTGRGEIMTPVRGIPKLDLVVMQSGERVSTGKAYQKIDSLLPGRPDHRSSEEVKKQFCCSSVKEIAENMYNIFEDAVLPECPIACDMKSSLVSNGAIGAMMSGSGSAVFGIFESADAASKAEKNIGRGAVRAASAPAYEL